MLNASALERITQNNRQTFERLQLNSNSEQIISWTTLRDHLKDFYLIFVRLEKLSYSKPKNPQSLHKAQAIISDMLLKIEFLLEPPKTKLELSFRLEKVLELDVKFRELRDHCKEHSLLAVPKSYGRFSLLVVVAGISLLLNLVVPLLGTIVAAVLGAMALGGVLYQRFVRASYPAQHLLNKSHRDIQTCVEHDNDEQGMRLSSAAQVTAMTGAVLAPRSEASFDNRPEYFADPGVIVIGSEEWSAQTPNVRIEGLTRKEDPNKPESRNIIVIEGLKGQEWKNKPIAVKVEVLKEQKDKVNDIINEWKGIFPQPIFKNWEPLVGIWNQIFQQPLMYRGALNAHIDGVLTELKQNSVKNQQYIALAEKLSAEYKVFEAILSDGDLLIALAAQIEVDNRRACSTPHAPQSPEETAEVDRGEATHSIGLH